jgi:hypothetical protein
MTKRNEWAGQIKAAWQRSLDGIFEAGCLLIEAKASLPHGEFLAMIVRELPFSERTAQKLMAIAAWDNRKQIKATFASYLPVSPFALYELSRLPDAAFEEAVADGRIHVEMSRRDAEFLREGEEAAQAWEAREAQPQHHHAECPTVIIRPARPGEPAAKMITVVTKDVTVGYAAPYRLGPPQTLRLIPPEVERGLEREGHEHLFAELTAALKALVAAGEAPKIEHEIIEYMERNALHHVWGRGAAILLAACQKLAKAVAEQVG